MRFAFIQLNPTIGDLEGNYKKIASALSSLEDKVDLAILPEMSLLGYPPKDLLERPEFVDAIDKYISKILKLSKKLAVVLGAVRKNTHAGRSLFNSAFFLHNEKICHIHDKMLLPYYDVFDENRYFEPGNTLSVFEFMGKKIALTVCEDIWAKTELLGFAGRYKTDPLSEIKPESIDYLINISASPFSKKKFDGKMKVFSELTQKLKTTLIYVNTVGANDEIVFDGRSFVIDNGKPVKICPAFKEGCFIYDSDKSEIVLPQRTEIEDIYNALILGLSDYCKKTGFRKVIVGLSGGIDSAVTAAIAAAALGSDNVKAIMMPSRFTSDESTKDAMALAENLELELFNLPIEGIFTQFLSVLNPIFENETKEITKENLQARIRGVLLMALSNNFGWLLLSTGNKSEMAVGYTTLYGDLAGGLALISDLYKTEVYRLANFLNRDRGIIPENILKKAPSAELAPNQKDQDTLPEYEILDRILELYLEELKVPKAIIDLGIDSATVRKVVELVDRNEYKRRQAPPGIKISVKAFGYGRRYPIAKSHGIF
ncbi:MAG: NAD+ synthase [bacterium]|nr:MAG: NAD+ synthase [bacterium]